jgi:hypothetical protein
MSADILDQLNVDVAKAAGQDELARPAAEPDARLQGNPVKKLRYSHALLIDMIIANQGRINQTELAARFGYSASWLSQVMCSDIFQAKLMERTAEIVDPTLVASVEQRLKGQLARSLEILEEKLSKPEVSDNLVLRTLEISSRALGYGARDPQVNVQVNVENHLENLGGRLVDLLHRKKDEAKASPPIIQLENS